MRSEAVSLSRLRALDCRPGWWALLPPLFALALAVVAVGCRGAHTATWWSLFLTPRLALALTLGSRWAVFPLGPFQNFGLVLSLPHPRSAWTSLTSPRSVCSRRRRRTASRPHATPRPARHDPLRFLSLACFVFLPTMANSLACAIEQCALLSMANGLQLFHATMLATRPPLCHPHPALSNRCLSDCQVARRRPSCSTSPCGSTSRRTASCSSSSATCSLRRRAWRPRRRLY